MFKSIIYIDNICLSIYNELHQMCRKTIGAGIQ